MVTGPTGATGAGFTAIVNPSANAVLTATGTSTSIAYAQPNLTFDGTTLSVTSNIRTSDGTVSAPTYAFTSETNSGLYRVGASSLSFAIAGTQSLRLNSNGIGIGRDATPGILINAYDPGSFNAFMQFEANGGEAGVGVQGRTALTVPEWQPVPAQLKFFHGGKAGGMGIFTTDATIPVSIWTNSTKKIDFSSSAIITYVPILTPDGSVSAPTHSFSNETNTGLYRAGSSQLGFTVAGTRRMVISNSNVGIGTGTPTSILDIRDVSATLRVCDTTNRQPTIELNRNAGGTFGTSAIVDWRIQVSASGGNYQIVRGSNGTANVIPIHIDGASGSNVGINTTAPTAALDVSAGVELITQFRCTNPAAQGSIRLVGSGWPDASSVQIFHSSTQQGMWCFNNNPLNFYTGNINSARMTILSNGNVGIATTSPAFTVDICGSIRSSASNLTNTTITQNLYAPSTADVSAIAYINMGLGQNGGAGGPSSNLQFLWLRGGGNPFRYAGINFGAFNGVSFYTYNTGSSLVTKYIGALATSQSQLDVCGSILTLSSAGNVGIGTATTNQRFVVQDASGGFFFSAPVGITTAYNRIKSITTTDTGVRDLMIDTNNNTGMPTMYLGSNGNVGINTAAPAFTLDVSGTETIRATAGTGSGLILSNANTGTVPTGNANTWNESLYFTGNRRAWGIGIETTNAVSYALGFFDYTAATGGPIAGTRYIRGYILGADAANNTPLNFTGQHRCFVKDRGFNDLQSLIGLVVCADNNETMNMAGGLKRGKDAITISESLPIVSLVSKPNDKRVFGVIAVAEDPSIREDTYGNFVTPFIKEAGDTRAFINSVGEGAIWVTNAGGNVESGDYVSSSAIPGYAQRQADDVLHNYTIAKITMDCDFTAPIQPKYTILKDASGNNVIDEKGNVCWTQQIDASGNLVFETAYDIRYVDASGSIVDISENAFIAAFLPCTYHCG